MSEKLVTQEEMKVLCNWIQRALSQNLPISFKYGGKPSSEFLNLWQISRKNSSLDNGVILHHVVSRDPKTRLECTFELKEFPDFPAAEWVAKIKNTGQSDTPIIEDIQALDITWDCCEEGDPVLHYSKGSNCQIDDFILKEEALMKPSPRVKITSVGGRSSSGNLPFFNLQTGDKGITIAVGWTGQWAVEFVRDEKDNVRIRAGMEKTYLKLYPGEEIRIPSILLLFWKDDRMRGHNMLRRFIINYDIPAPDGKQVVAPICCTTWGGMRSLRHLERIRTIKKHGLQFDYYWVDAGWYGPKNSYCPDVFTGDWWKHVGNWNYNPSAHPEGLKPLSDAAHAIGMRFLLWFEPERAKCGTPLTVQHPEWFLGEREPGNDLLFNLGLPEARHWLTDFISGLITEHGVDCYRQDFNMEPLSYWQAADEADRQGMTEIHYIEGLYEFWDELLQRHPHLLIDNCASGGRRIDIETIGRSIPLWRSDYQCWPTFDPIGEQVQTYGLSHWVPLNAGGTGKQPGDTYGFRSAMSAGVSFGLFTTRNHEIGPDYSFEWVHKMIADYKRARPLFYGDFYPLTGCSVSPLDWLAYQLYRPDLGEGMILAFRRPKSLITKSVFLLQGLEQRAQYEMGITDTGEKFKVSGQSLVTKGISIAMQKTPDSRLIFYGKVG